MITNKSIGKRIQKRRKEMGFTQEELAEKVNISTNFLACIETGKRSGSFETYMKLVEVLNTSFDYITQDVVEAAGSNVRKEELIKHFDCSNEVKQKLIVQIAEFISDCRL